MDYELLKIEEVRSLIPNRIKESHKGTYGKVALLGGAVCGGAFAVGTLVEGHIGVPESDGDTSFDLLGVTVGPLTGKRFG